MTRNMLSNFLFTALEDKCFLHSYGEASKERKTIVFDTIPYESKEWNKKSTALEWYTFKQLRCAPKKKLCFLVKLSVERGLVSATFDSNELNAAYCYACNFLHLTRRS